LVYKNIPNSIALFKTSFTGLHRLGIWSPNMIVGVTFWAGAEYITGQLKIPHLKFLFPCCLHNDIRTYKRQRVETYPVVYRSASGNPSIRQTTSAAFMFHPWSQIALHSPSYFTSTLPSQTCFPPTSRTSEPLVILKPNKRAIGRRKRDIFIGSRSRRNFKSLVEFHSALALFTRHWWWPSRLNVCTQAPSVRRLNEWLVTQSSLKGCVMHKLLCYQYHRFFSSHKHRWIKCQRRICTGLVSIWICWHIPVIRWTICNYYIDNSEGPQ